MYNTLHQGAQHGCGYGHRGHSHHAGRWGQAGPWARGGWYQPPVNIEELEDRFELHLAAPGRSKSDFQLNVQGEVLTIAYKRQEESDLATQPNWKRREFRTVSFERQFLLSAKIDAEGINASYTDGVLLVVLPKTTEARTPAKDIFVA